MITTNNSQFKNKRLSNKNSSTKKREQPPVLTTQYKELFRSYSQTMLKNKSLINTAGMAATGRTVNIDNTNGAKSILVQDIDNL